jgi:hypothetical protein
MSDQQPVEFRLSIEEARSTLQFGYWACGIWILLGAAIGFYAGGLSGVLGIGWVFFISAPAVLAFFWYQARKATNDRAVKLRIGPDGIALPEHATQVIPWESIKKISYVRRKDKSPTMEVDIDDPDKHALIGLTKKLARTNAFLASGEIIVDIDVLEGDPVDVFVAIKRFRPDLTVYGP